MEAQLATLLDRLFALEPKFDEEDEPMPVLVRLSKEAHEEWKAYYDAHAQEQVDLTGDLSAAWSKLEEYAARLALVVHFVRWAIGGHLIMLRCMLREYDFIIRVGYKRARWGAAQSVSIYSLSLCVVSSAVRGFAVRSISDWKNGYAAECDGCEERKNCS